MSLFVVAASIGIVQSELEKLLADQASLGVAKKLGVRAMAVQRFIGGEVSVSKAYAHGMLQSKLRPCGTAWSGKVHPVHRSVGPAQECSSAGPVRGPTN